jgi:hypothetical protein
MADPDKNPKVSIGANIEVGKEAAAEISRGISSVGSNIGLAATVGTVSAGVAKVIAKSSLPPVQKAGIVVAGSIIGGGIHIGASAINRLNNIVVSSNSISTSDTTNNTTSDDSTTNLGDGVNKLIGESNSDLSNLILSINMITYSCLSLVGILLIIILIKFYLDENKVQLKLSGLIGTNLNNNLNYYLIKIIKLNKLTSSVYIFIIFILLLVGLGFDCYFVTLLHENLDKYINIHINR